MEKVNEMAEGITVTEAPVRKTRDEIMGKTKRPAVSGKWAIFNVCHQINIHYCSNIWSW